MKFLFPKTDHDEKYDHEGYNSCSFVEFLQWKHISTATNYFKENFTVEETPNFGGSGGLSSKTTIVS